MATVEMQLQEEAFRKLDRKLAQLQILDRNKALQTSMRRAMSTIRKVAQREAPSGEGTKGAKLRQAKAFRLKAWSDRNEPAIVGKIGASRRAPHFHLVELGHRMVSRDKRPVSGPKTPGGMVQPRPFLSKGVYATRQQVGAQLMQEVIREIEKIVALS